MNAGGPSGAAVSRVRRWSPWHAVCTAVLGLGTAAVAICTQHVELAQVISVSVSAAVGAGLMAAAGFGPGARATRTVELSASPEAVEIQGPSTTLAAEVMTWIAFATFVATVYGDLFFMGVLGIVIGLAGLYDASIVRTWERRNDAALGWVVPDRARRLRRPFKRPTPIVIDRDARDS